MLPSLLNENLGMFTVLSMFIIGIKSRVNIDSTDAMINTKLQEVLSATSPPITTPQLDPANVPTVNAEEILVLSFISSCNEEKTLVVANIAAKPKPYINLANEK